MPLSHNSSFSATDTRSGVTMSKRILVVVDQEIILQFLHEKLDKLGFHVTFASHGSEGLRLLHESQFEGILLDLEMPAMGGFRMLRQLREQFHSIPIIVMSADPTRTMMRKAIEGGAQDYLMKPISYEILKYKCLRSFG